MLLKFPLIRLNTQKKQRVLFYGCISGVATVLSIVIWNVAFAGSSSGSTRGAAPTEKILTGAGRLNPQDAWNERMSNQFDLYLSRVISRIL